MVWERRAEHGTTFRLLHSVCVYTSAHECAFVCVLCALGTVIDDCRGINWLKRGLGFTADRLSYMSVGGGGLISAGVSVLF